MRRGIILILLSICAWSATATAQPPPPEPVVRESGFVTRWPGYPYEDRRTVKSLDVGLVMSARSPIGYVPGPPFLYLNLAGTYANRFVQIDARSMFVPLAIDALLGIGMLNLNLGQSDDFPPFLQLLNSRVGHGVWELGHGRVGFVFAATERRSWMYALHTHATFFGAPLTGLPAFAVGLGGALTHVWIDPLWDLSVSAYGGPEIGNFEWYGGAEVVWRRALVEHFGGYLRWNANVHASLLNEDVLPAGYLEAGFSFGNWE